MARQDGYNYFNGAPPGKRRLTKRERFLAAGLAAVLLLAWAGWTLQACLYPGWRLEGLFPKERIVEIHVEQRQRESGAVVAERTLSPQEQEAFYQAIGQTTLWMNNPVRFQEQGAYDYAVSCYDGEGGQECYLWVHGQGEWMDVYSQQAEESQPRANGMGKILSSPLGGYLEALFT